jgi:hypothetical protein
MEKPVLVFWEDKYKVDLVTRTVQSAYEGVKKIWGG